MKRTGLTFLLIFTIALCWSPVAQAEEQKILSILNWESYLDPEVIARFETENNVRVQQTYFVSDEDRDSKLIATRGNAFDLILISDARIAEYVKLGWIAPLDRDKLTNLKHIDPKWAKLFPESSDYAVPYFWGTLGIVYRTDLVSTPITSWKQLFVPVGELRNRIMMMEDAREIVCMGLKALGYSVNSEDPQAYREVERLLLEQRPYVKSYAYVSIAEDSPLVSGEVVAAMAYNGDALAVSEYHDKISYVLPKEGSNFWVDYFAVAAKARHPELAYKFLDFINEPKIAARQAESLYYASPNKSAEKYLSADFLANSAIYPSAESLKNSEVYQRISPWITLQRNIIGRKLYQQEP